MTNVAILGAGNIATSMARTLAGMKARGQEVSLYAIAAREQARADAFAEKWGFEKSHGSYEALVEDPKVDLIYIATPHSHHYEQIKLCINAGKAVLCEKSFTGNARQAEEVLALAENKNVLLTEAIWTRYMPSRKIVNDLLASGEIGDVVTMNANLGYAISGVERIQKLELAGGALLDLGVYTLNFASMFFGDDVIRMESSVEKFASGTDRSENITLYYRDGKTATLQSNAQVNLSRRGCIYGTKGTIVIDNINNPHFIDVYPNMQNSEEKRRIEVPEQITGYEYQVEACMHALAHGEIECPEMPHRETLRIMKVMDQLRKDWNMVYPFD